MSTDGQGELFADADDVTVRDLRAAARTFAKSGSTSDLDTLEAELEWWHAQATWEP